MQRIDEARTELMAVADRFMVLGARWCLDDRQVVDLLGLQRPIHPMFDEDDVAVGVRMAGADAERRMRLLVEIDVLLPRLVGDADAIPLWLRSPSVGYADERVTPLVALASGASAALALRNYLSEIGTGERMRA